jgi:hypothetical protein
MNMKIRTCITFLLLIASQLLLAQMKDYGYKRALTISENKWYSITLADDVFEKISPDFSDLRIFGITSTEFKKNDTVEAPYIIKISEGERIQNEIAFKLVNESKNDKGYYFTFETPSKSDVNQLKLNFRQENFDWHLTLEGSPNQQEWFSILDDYRILSIKNEATDFKFTTVNFPASNYKYYRIALKTDVKPSLLNATLLLNEIKGSSFRNHLLLSNQIKEEKKNKQTVLSFSLPSVVPVADLKINVHDKFDYYRTITIEYLNDSIKTQQGWIYNYNTLVSGTLNSLDKNIFKFSSTFLKKIKITIDNQDNQPLHIDSILLRSFVYQLYTRINVPADYYLVYGNKQASKPAYDLDHFTDKIPNELSSLKLGPEIAIEKAEVQKTRALIENKAWLWALMIVLIIVLGVFSFKLMKKSNA